MMIGIVVVLTIVLGLIIFIVLRLGLFAPKAIIKNGATNQQHNPHVREPFSPADAVHFMTQGGRLRNNNIVICAALFFHDLHLEVEELREMFNERVLHDTRFRRLRQRVVGWDLNNTEVNRNQRRDNSKTDDSTPGIWERLRSLHRELRPGTGLQWEVLEPEEVDLAYHIVEQDMRSEEEIERTRNKDKQQSNEDVREQEGGATRCKLNCDKHRLEDVMSSMAEERLDMNRPMWRGHLIRYAPHCDALVLRVHHSVADGFSLVNFLLACTDQHFRPLQREQIPGQQQKEEERGVPLPSPISQAAFGVTWQDRVVLLGRAMRGFPASLYRLTALKPDPREIFLSRPAPASSRKLRVSILSPSLSLQQVREIAKAAKTTVNDVLISAVSAALGKYQAEDQAGFPSSGTKEKEITTSTQQSKTPKNAVWRDVKIFLPVGSAFSGSRKVELQNRIGMAVLPIPLDLRYTQTIKDKKGKTTTETKTQEVSPAARLQEVKKRLDDAKTRPDFFLSYYLAYFISLAFPPMLLRYTAQKTTTNTSLLLTNVRGPAGKATFRGKDISEMVFFVPAGDFLNTGLYFFSYGADISVGLCCDVSTQTTRPKRLLALLQEEISLLHASIQIKTRS